MWGGPRFPDHWMAGDNAGLITEGLIGRMSTRTERRRQIAAFKARSGMNFVQGIKTTAQIAREHGVHPVQVSQWRSVIRDRLPERFEPGDTPAEDPERFVADGHRKLGERTVDPDYLNRSPMDPGPLKWRAGSLPPGPPSESVLPGGSRRAIELVLGFPIRSTVAHQPRLASGLGPSTVRRGGIPPAWNRRPDPANVRSITR